MFGCQRSRHLILLSAGAGADVGWWLSFLPRWNGVSLLPEAPLSSLDLHLFTDVSSRRVGGVFGPRWFSILLTEFASIPWFPDPSVIPFWETLAVLLAFFIWTPLLSSCQLVIHTDNLALVYALSRSTCNKSTTRLLFALFLRVPLVGSNVQLAHIPSCLNIDVDHLSCLQMQQSLLDPPDADPVPSSLPFDVWNL